MRYVTISIALCIASLFGTAYLFHLVSDTWASFPMWMTAVIFDVAAAFNLNIAIQLALRPDSTGEKK